VGGIAVVMLGVAASFDTTRSALEYMWGTMRGGYTVAERLEQFGPEVDERLRPVFDAAGVKYPPAELAFVAFKDSKVLELYAKDGKEPWRFIKEYPVLAASGVLGPKLKEGDLQVPEGIYRLELLNPNSRFHLSVRLDYPNEFDRRMAAVEGRSGLGGDIMIHGSAVSVGCLAVGNAAADVFVLSGLVGKERVKVVISPTDFRAGPTTGPTIGPTTGPMSTGPASTAPTTRGPVGEPTWVRELYQALRDELRQFQKRR
jgi:hypothetical protein